jgi:hypothetical protein
MMLRHPFRRPGVEFYVVNESASFVGSACAEVTVARPIVGEKVVVLAGVLVETLPQSSERTNEEVESGGVGVDKDLGAVCVRGKVKDVRNWDVCLVFVAHWFSGYWLLSFAFVTRDA